MAGWEAWLAGWLRGLDVWTCAQKISPFYRTLSSIRAAAQKTWIFSLFPPSKLRESSQPKGPPTYLEDSVAGGLSSLADWLAHSPGYLALRSD